jgi:hypothetical protein
VIEVVIIAADIPDAVAAARRNRVAPGRYLDVLPSHDIMNRIRGREIGTVIVTPAAADSKRCEQHIVEMEIHSALNSPNAVWLREQGRVAREDIA